MPFPLSQARSEFEWLGHVVAVHDLGRYSLVEYVHEKSGDTFYGGVIDGKSTACSYKTVERAIVGCIAIAAEGMNGSADSYFFKMIDEAA